MKMDLHFIINPSGTFVRYYAKTIGSGSEVYDINRSWKTCAFGFKTSYGRKTTPNVELSSVVPGEKFKLYSIQEVETILSKLEEEK